MVENCFGKGPEGWCSYDYHASMVSGGRNVFILATWQRAGGVDGSGYVWTDHTRWSADTPERPLSILPLIFYRSWVDADPIDLRGATTSVFLRGDDLCLDGARCLFWVHAHNTRWHCGGSPVSISDGCWASEPSRVRLTVDEDVWYCSWSLDRDNPAPLERVLGEAESYGFSFIGFSSEVTGRLCMDEFRIVGSAE